MTGDASDEAEKAPAVLVFLRMVRPVVVVTKISGLPSPSKSLIVALRALGTLKFTFWAKLMLPMVDVF